MFTTECVKRHPPNLALTQECLNTDVAHIQKPASPCWIQSQLLLVLVEVLPANRHGSVHGVSLLTLCVVLYIVLLLCGAKERHITPIYTGYLEK